MYRTQSSAKRHNSRQSFFFCISGCFFFRFDDSIFGLRKALPNLRRGRSILTDPVAQRDNQISHLIHMSTRMFLTYQGGFSMQHPKRSLAFLAGLLGVILLAGACHKKVAPVPPTPPPPPPPAPTVSLTAEPSTVEKGQSVTLSWTSQNATDLTLDPGVGKVQAQGSTTVTPQDSTTYTLTANGPGGSQTATARVTVTAPPPPPPPPQEVKVSDEELFGQNMKDAYLRLRQVRHSY